MEGLIKGLINVAIGHNNEDDQNHNSDEQRSRSTWAQVVSGEPDDDQAEHHTTRPNRVPAHGSYQPDEDRERPNYYPNQKEEPEKNADGWQTAHKKQHKRPQKIRMDHWNSYKCDPSEQQYSDEVKHVNIDPTEEELGNYKKACEKLWDLDINRLVPGKDYEIDVGEGKRVYDRQDMAASNLFTWLDEDVLKRPTFSRFFALLDNYNPHEGYKEVVTAQERQEQAAFIEEISRTAPIKYLHSYLSCTGMFRESYGEFKEMLTDLWFTLYGRGGTSGSSSSFEHVFVGEIKSRGEEEVSGFHNWLQFYLEEAKGRVDYQGYILPRRHGNFPDSEAQLLTVQFEWNGVLKNLSSMFIGVSPEFELALYTLCFFAGRDDNHVQVGPYPVNIKCYHLGNKIGSAFPIAES